MKSATASAILVLALALPVIFLFTGCNDFVLSELLDGEEGVAGLKSPLSLHPSTHTLSVTETIDFDASGGSTPYTFAVISGTGTINATTGAYTAPVAAGTDVVQVQDSGGATSNATVTITDTGLLTLIPPNVTVAVNNGLTFMATGGVGPYFYTLTATGSGSPTVDLNTGVYVAGASPGTDIVQVQDSALPVPNTDTATITVSNVATNVDYDITGITIPGAALAGATISGTNFDVDNIGSADGSKTVYWNLYASANTVLGPGDELLRTGSTGPLASSGTTNIPVTTGSWPASSGNYYIIVTVSAEDDLTTANNIQVTGGQISVTQPDVDYDVTVVSNTGGTDAGGAIAGNFTVQNIGADNGSQIINWDAYVSTNAALGGGETLIDSGSTAALNSGASAGPIAFTGTWPAGPGNHYLIVLVTASDDNNSANDDDNSGVIVTTIPDVDYDVTVVNNTGGTIAGGAITGNFTVQNIGTDNGSQTVDWEAYVSTDASLGAGDTLIDSGSTAALNSGASAGPIGFTGTWPGSPGTYYLIVVATAADDVNGANDEENNGGTAISAPTVDYDVTVVNNAGGTVASGPVAGNFTVQNVGTDNGSQIVSWAAYVSTDTILGGGDTFIDSGSTAALNSGASAGPIAFTGTWPGSPGTYYLIVNVSAADDVNGANDYDDNGGTAITGPDVDYDVTVVNNTGGTVAAGPIAGNFTVQNIGAANGSQTVNWEAYVSTDAVLGGGDTFIDSGSTVALNSGASAGPIGFTGTWPGSAGTYYLIVSVSAADDVNGANDYDDNGGTAITGPDVDYDVTVVNNTGGTVATGPIAGNFSVQNIGADNGSQTVFWEAYVSTNATLGGGDTFIDSGSTAALNSGASAGPIAFTGTWPGSAGTYYLIVNVSATDDVNSGNDYDDNGGTAITGPDVDYDVTVVNNAGGTVATGPIAGNFSVQNIGADNGGQTVFWEAYVSMDATLGVGDTFIDSGSTVALNSGATAGPIAFTGTWPGSAGTYYLIVAVSAADDVNSGNDEQDNGGTAITGPNVDYDVIVVNNTGGTTAGGLISGDFTVQNIGADNGSQTVFWDAYVSTDAVLGGGDNFIDSGSTAALNSGATAGPIAFTGTWPGSAGTYYLIVAVSAADDVNAGNDYDDNGGTAIAGGPGPDYEITPAGLPANGTPGAALIGPPNFDIDNLTANPGTQIINWIVYTSSDQVLDGGDTVIDSGSTGPLGAAPDSVNIPFTGNWPGFGSYYYLIIDIAADDDDNPVNDRLVTSAIPVPDSFPEIESNDDGPPNPAASDVHNIGVRNQYELIEITGTMEGPSGQYDTFEFQAGPGVTKIEMTATWTTGFDDLDIDFWHNINGGTTLGSADVDVDVEPGSPPWSIIGLTPGENYCVGLWQWLDGAPGSIGAPYTLLIRLLP